MGIRAMEEHINLLIRKKLKEIKSLSETLDNSDDLEVILKLLWQIEREACLTREYIAKNIAIEEQ